MRLNAHILRRFSAPYFVIIFYETFLLVNSENFIWRETTLSNAKQKTENRKVFWCLQGQRKGVLEKNGLIGNVRDVAYFNSTLEYKIIYPTGKSDHTKNDNFGGVQIIFFKSLKEI